MSDGRVLSEGEIQQTEQWAETLVFAQGAYVKAVVGNLIATIRDRDHEIKRLSELTLHELIADSKGINMKIGGASGKAFMAALVKFFEDNGGKNFLAMTVAKDGYKYQIEIRNLNGELSAAEKLGMAEQQNTIMREVLERIANFGPFSGWGHSLAAEALAKVQAIGGIGGAPPNAPSPSSDR